MKLTINLKLQPTPEQHAALLATIERANAACNAASDIAWEQQTFGQFALHKLAYKRLRSEFGLTAQVTVRCIAKVADAYKPDRKSKRVFRPHGSIAYDDRILRFKPGDMVSIWTLAGRQVIPFVCGEYQRRYLPFRKGEVDLVYHRGAFYLNVVCEVDEPPTNAVGDILGVDLGIVNIATDSDGTTYSGASVEQKRRIYAHRRRNLQRRGTPSAKRKLRKLSGKQRRFQRNTNHVISKAIVATAQRTGRAIALEDLTGIRGRVTARRRQRARLHNWSFFQLRSLIVYKARLAGVPVFLVDPKNTSRTCPACGCVDKANRPTQATFSCGSCGFAAPADHVAARNIAFRARAAVNQPNELLAQGSASG